MDYSQFITRLGELMVIPVVDPNSGTPFNDTNANNMLPAIIDYAEQRMYRDLDLIETVTTVTSHLVAASRSVLIPGNMIVLNQMNVITPVGDSPDQLGATRYPLRRVSVDFLNLTAPTASASIGTPSIPKYFANLDNTTALVAASPDAAYTVEFVGTIRPTVLSSSNTSTILTTYLPDLFLLASMVQASGYQKNWSLKSDDPRMPVNWESQYQQLAKSALVEEARKKAQSSGWEPYTPTPIATPPRA